MLTELAVRDLGVIDDLRLVLGAGMTALTTRGRTVSFTPLFSALPLEASRSRMSSVMSASSTWVTWAVV